MSVRILHGDCRDVLRTLPDESVHCCVTSPPYFGLRDYGTANWDGGDPTCDHVRSKKDTVLGSSSTLGYPSDGGARRIGNENTYHEAYTAQFRDECGKCGARRIDRQIGLESTPDAYVAELVAVFREVRRVLRKDGTLWLNLGDSYSGGGGYSPGSPSNVARQERRSAGNDCDGSFVVSGEHNYTPRRGTGKVLGLKPKDLIGVPWLVAFALRADGWYLRSDIIWSKPNPMPESVTDRPTKAHEYLFLLSKSERYFYDAEAIKEEGTIAAGTLGAKGSAERASTPGVNSRPPEYKVYDGTRNKRSVWHIATRPFSEAHFATFPPDLIEPCINAGTSEKGCCAKCSAPWKREVESSVSWPERRGGKGDNADRQDGGKACNAERTSTTTGWSPSCSCDAAVVPCTVLDPFGGAGTTGLVADRLQRSAILIELNPEYATMSERRLGADAGMFAEIVAA